MVIHKFDKQEHKDNQFHSFRLFFYSPDIKQQNTYMFSINQKKSQDLN